MGQMYQWSSWKVSEAFLGDAINSTAHRALVMVNNKLNVAGDAYGGEGGTSRTLGQNGTHSPHGNRFLLGNSKSTELSSDKWQYRLYRHDRGIPHVGTQGR
jgi:hypothetical protein